jgi:hypothetical protein
VGHQQVLSQWKRIVLRRDVAVNSLDVRCSMFVAAVDVRSDTDHASPQQDVLDDYHGSKTSAVTELLITLIEHSVPAHHPTSRLPYGTLHLRLKELRAHFHELLGREPQHCTRVWRCWLMIKLSV